MYNMANQIVIQPPEKAGFITNKVLVLIKVILVSVSLKLIENLVLQAVIVSTIMSGLFMHSSV